jgi:heparinase II/III-like protein
MSKDELVDRVSQQVHARVDAYRARRGYDFTQITPNEVPADQQGTFFFAAAEVPGIVEFLNARYPAVAANILSSAEKILQHRFDLLGYEGLDYGLEIDWHLDVIHQKRGPSKPAFQIKYLDYAEVGDSKITWELNRHQHLVTLAKAFRLTGDPRFAREIVEQWKAWRAANPYPIGVNWASSLEVAFRSLSWMWVYYLMQGTAEMTPELRSEWVKALRLSGRHIDTYLSTYFSPNTHLLGEAVALFFLGTLFPELPKAKQWKDRGWKVVLEAARTQVRQDGFYFEQSTYYHVYALDFFLHARILAARNAVPIPAEYDSTILKMLDALCLLGRAGVVPSMGDDDGGRVFDARRNRAPHLLDPLSTGAILYQRGDFKFLAGSPREETVWLLGTAAVAQFEELRTYEPSGASTGLRDSGLYLMADPDTQQQILIDAGPQGPGNAGHGHADALSIHLVTGGENFLMDPGTLEYVGESFADRDFFRGTAAHNTLRVDERDQAEGAPPFAWRGLPNVSTEQWVAGQGFDLFVGRHDGYRRLASPVLHERWVFHCKGQFWVVRDVAKGEGKHQLELSWHLGEKLSPNSAKDYVFGIGQETLGLITAEGHGWSQSAQRGIWSPVYGRQERNMMVTFGKAGDLPCEFVTLLLPNVNERVGRLERVDSEARVRVYRYTREGEDHWFFFSEPGCAWRAGDWASDAYFLYWSYNRREERRSLNLCGGSRADLQGRRILTGDTMMAFVEVTEAGGKAELFASDPQRVRIESTMNILDPRPSESDPRKIGV